MHPMPEGMVARCRRCRSSLYQSTRHSIPQASHGYIAALLFLAILVTTPLLTTHITGQSYSSRLVDAALAYENRGLPDLALVVLWTAFLLPSMRILGALYVLLPLQLGRPMWGAAGVFRTIEQLKPYAMLDVFLLSLLVAYVKISDLAELDLEPASFALAGTVVALALADWYLEPEAVWEALAPQARADPARLPRRKLAACRICEQVVAIPGSIKAGGGLCPRCGAPIWRRLPGSIQRCWAFLLAGALLYLPANLLPVMEVTYLGRDKADTILTGVRALADAGMWPLALLIFFASVLVPLCKIIALVFLLLSVQFGWGRARRSRTRLLQMLEAIGRWSMIDIFVVGLVSALVQAGNVASIRPGAGASAFAAVVLLTMIASRAFDSRLIWDPTAHAS